MGIASFTHATWVVYCCEKWSRSPSTALGSHIRRRRRRRSNCTSRAEANASALSSK
jgi:hypothetical protein